MRDGGAVFGLGNLCPHRGGQIGDGRVRGGAAICPMHQWDFDLPAP
jgi:nitrite reductase/ring-hydroxylating ferredoxin subunit